MKYCFNGNDCTYRRCIFKHSPHRNERNQKCLMADDCDRKVCHFLHSQLFYARMAHRRQFPHEFPCYYKNECYRKDCHFAHSPGPDEEQHECKWMASCSRAVCTFQHGIVNDVTVQNSCDCANDECNCGNECNSCPSEESSLQNDDEEEKND